MALARIGDRGELEYAGVGNIEARVVGIDGVARSLTSTAGTLGSAFHRRVHVEHTSLALGELLVLFSDGLKARLDLTNEPVAVRSHPIAIAQLLRDRFGRGTDDALVAVVR